MNAIARIVPYTLATAVVAGVAGLVVYDLWTSELPHPAAASESEASEEVQAVMQKIESATPPAPDEVRNFVLFRMLDFGRDGLQQVTTGAQFASSRDSMPEQSWCYVERKTDPLRAVRRFTLALKEGKGPVLDVPITPEAAADLETTVDVLNEARAYCRFLADG